MGPDINFVDADFSLLDTKPFWIQKGLLHNVKNGLTTQKIFFFEKLRYDHHNVTAGKETSYLSSFGAKNLL